MAKCPDGCSCGRHRGPWTGKERADMKGRQPTLRHGHTWKDPSTGRPRASLTYKSWQSMKYRCDKRADYTARGITVCERWQVFDNFLADMGERPSAAHSIDRIDNDGPYGPENCRWATRSEQQQNKRWQGRNQYGSWGPQEHVKPPASTVRR